MKVHFPCTLCEINRTISDECKMQKQVNMQKYLHMIDETKKYKLIVHHFKINILNSKLNTQKADKSKL